MHIENSLTCEDDNITIVDPILAAHVVGTICGQMTPSYQSSGPNLQITFNSNSVKETKGFMIKYKSILNSDCRNDKLIATDVDSYLVSPGYPSRYYSNLACRWTISSNDPRRTIEVEVMHVGISGTPPACNDDKLEVDYLHSSSPNEVICGSSTPTQRFVSMGNTLLITFTSDSANEGQGFYIRYRQVQGNTSSASCNQTLTATGTEQVLTSPGYPHISLMSQTCSYTIRAQSGYHIRVTLNDLDIERARVCRYDSLAISDGTSTLDELWCGKSAGEVVNSQRNDITVTYSIDNSNNGHGFSLKYSAVRETASSVQTMTLPTRSTPLYLSSPGFEKRYPRGITYTYILTADPRQQIRLRVKESYLRYNTANGACLSQRVRLYDGPSSASLQLKSMNTRQYGWCALDLPVFVSSSNYMTMAYKTSNSADHARIGFVLTYEHGNFNDMYPYTCGGIYLASSQGTAITSPNYPQNYDSNLICKWIIWAASNTTEIRLAGNFSLVGGIGANCGGDYLTVYDGAAEPTNFLSKLCGTSSDTLQSTGNLLTIVMKTDSGYNGKGFRFLFYETTDPLPCGGSLAASLTNSYLRQRIRPNTSCEWVFTRESNDTYIKLKLLSYDIGMRNNGTCGADHVAIYDGNSEASTRIALLCGYRSVATFVGTGGQMMVKLVTGASPVGYGFNIEYSSSAAERCSTKDRRATGLVAYLQSPSYPNQYESNLRCTWLIDTGKADYIVMFNILLASIVYSDGCKDDYLAAYDGMSEASSVQLGKWCQSVDRTETQHSTQQYVTIVFHTNEDVSGGGFRLSYWRDAKAIEGGSGALGTNVGAIVGGIFGGLILLAVVIVVIVCVVKRPLSKGANSSYGGGQAAPAVTYQPQRATAYMHPPSTSPNAYAYDNRTYNAIPHDHFPQYNAHPKHQGSNYKVQDHEYSQPGPVHDHEYAHLGHVQGHDYSRAGPNQANTYSQPRPVERDEYSQAGPFDRDEYSQSGPVERDEYSQSGPVQQNGYSQAIHMSPPRYDDIQSAGNNDLSVSYI
ncbi:cubilin-like [Haliotis rufescens]|uniref:cubilin-like n=1 Tax=Haliotis rufescens TaxID=6454 RepID=UPI00201F05E1|nr:cubilin-like [Haliotis rufescens]